ncbi:hypothetical protein [Pseudomonas sp. CLCA07]
MANGAGKITIRYLKKLLLIIYLLKSYDYYVERLSGMGIGFPVLLFGGTFIVLTVALFMTAYIRQTLIRHLFALVGSALNILVTTTSSRRCCS